MKLRCHISAGCEIPMQYPNLVKARYGKLKGKGWINQLLPEDKAALIAIGLEHAQHGHLGGQARVKSATRDAMGRFCSKSATDNTVLS